MVDGPAAPGIDGAGAGATSQSMTKVASLADPRQCPPMADLSMPAATQLSRRTDCGQAAPAGSLGSFERRVALTEAPVPSLDWGGGSGAWQRSAPASHARLIAPAFVPKTGAARHPWGK